MSEVAPRLSADEDADLAACEAVITRGLKTFREVGEALARIRDGRLYRDVYGTFEDYCRERWDLSARHVNRTIEASRVAGILGPIGPVPANEAQARELAPLLDDPDRLRETWRRAVEPAGGKPTAADVAAARTGARSRPAWMTPQIAAAMARADVAFAEAVEESLTALEEMARLGVFASAASLPAAAPENARDVIAAWAADQLRRCDLAGINDIGTLARVAKLAQDVHNAWAVSGLANGRAVGLLISGGTA